MSVRERGREDGGEPGLEGRLDPGEELLWSGAPRRGVVLRGADLGMIPFSILWLAVALYWEVAVVIQGAPPFFVVFGACFVLFGLYLVVGRFVVDARRRARTRYGLTDRRVLIVSGLLESTVTSLPLQTLDEVVVEEHADGSGTVFLGRPDARMPAWYGSSWPGAHRSRRRTFERIDDARAVCDLLLEARQRARDAHPPA